MISVVKYMQEYDKQRRNETRVLYLLGVPCNPVDEHCPCHCSMGVPLALAKHFLLTSSDKGLNGV